MNIKIYQQNILSSINSVSLVWLNVASLDFWDERFVDGVLSFFFFAGGDGDAVPQNDMIEPLGCTAFSLRKDSDHSLHFSTTLYCFFCF